MTRNSTNAAALLVGLILAALPWALAKDDDHSLSLAIVVHKSCTMESIGIAQLRKMVGGEVLLWPDSKPVVVIAQPDQSVTQQRMLRLLLKTTPLGYKHQLLALQFQGKELPTVKMLNSNEMAIKFVWNVPGAFAVVDTDAALAAASRVKVLRIDGKLPGEVGYPLQ